MGQKNERKLLLSELKSSRTIDKGTAAAVVVGDDGAQGYYYQSWTKGTKSGERKEEPSFSTP